MGPDNRRECTRTFARLLSGNRGGLDKRLQVFLPGRVGQDRRACGTCLCLHNHNRLLTIIAQTRQIDRLLGATFVAQISAL